MTRIEVQQNTPEWHLARLGEDRSAIGASALRDIQNFPWLRRFEWYRGLYNFVRERRILMEHLEIVPTLVEVNSSALHGIQYEPYALEAIDWIGEHTNYVKGLKGVSHSFDDYPWSMKRERGCLWRCDEPGLKFLMASPDFECYDSHFIGEIKCPVSKSMLSPSNLVSTYFAQVQQQLLVCGAQSCLLFAYHVATNQVTAVEVKFCREKFCDRLLPWLHRVHAALLYPTEVALDYGVFHPLQPAVDDYTVLMQHVCLPEVFPYVEDTELPHYGFDIAKHARARYFPKSEARYCERCRKRCGTLYCPDCVAQAHLKK